MTFKLGKIAEGCTKGARWQVPPSIREMNARVMESHGNAPWRKGKWETYSDGTSEYVTLENGEYDDISWEQVWED